MISVCSMEVRGCSNSRENTCYRQATLFGRLVHGEGGMKQGGLKGRMKGRNMLREKEGKRKEGKKRIARRERWEEGRETESANWDFLSTF